MSSVSRLSRHHPVVSITPWNVIKVSHRSSGVGRHLESNIWILLSSLRLISVARDRASALLSLTSHTKNAHNSLNK
jgi:hypothetical protein